MDVDGHNFPNLALMKISAWHKQQGDDVEMCFPMYEYDRVYMSKVFDFTPDFDTCLRADEIIKGGTGYDLKNKLPDHIENMQPDYSLYPQYKESFGFLTRGCPRGCEFCVVGEKEGYKSVKMSGLDTFWKGQKEIKLLDPNLLACKDHIELLQQLKDSGAWIDFTQGLDARLLSNKNIDLIKGLKLKIVHFAWDKASDEKFIVPKLKMFKEETGIDKRKATVYVLTNFNTSHEEDLYRIYTLRDLGYHPYVMIYDKYNAPKRTRLLQRWVNNRIIFDKCEKFEDFNSKIG